MGDPERMRTTLCDRGWRPLRVSLWTRATRWFSPGPHTAANPQAGCRVQEHARGRLAWPRLRNRLWLPPSPTLCPSSAPSPPPVTCPSVQPVGPWTPSLPLPTAQAVPCAPKSSSSSAKRQGRAGLQPWWACLPKLRGPGSRKSGVPGRVQVGLSLQSAHTVGVTLGPCPTPLPSTPWTQGDPCLRLTTVRAGLGGVGSSAPGTGQCPPRGQE